MEVEVLITSIDQPQLQRCLEAVNNQTVPFSRVVHINNVFPAHEAFNQGMSQTIGNWVMYIGGDVILSFDAVDKVTKVIDKNNLPNMCTYAFGLNDTFLDCKIGFTPVFNGSLFRTIICKDVYNFDNINTLGLRRNGWKVFKDLNLTIGTHFDQPDEFQVFQRFYRHGSRYPNDSCKSVKQNFIELLKKKEDPLYRYAIKVLEYAGKNTFYMGATSLLLDRENYEKYKTT